MSYNAQTDYERETLLRRIAEMEDEIAALDDELTQSNRLATLGVLAGMIAHEFNNLLTPLMSYSNLAISSPDDHELVKKAMTRTAEGTERLAHIATTILGFIREDTQLQSCDVQKVVEETLTCLVRQPEKNGIRVTRNIPVGLRARMRPVALQQVLLNLFLNAIRSMHEQGGELRIDAGLDETSDGPSVVISVTDTGPGISPEAMKRIFDPLFRVRSSMGLGETGSTSERLLAQTGNGLGLAVCRRLVEEAGGTIKVSNRSCGRGAQFLLNLPDGSII